jgi:hypothetical protein
MTKFASNDRLIRELAANLTPVSHLASPLLRIIVWLMPVLGIAAGLAMVQDIQPLLQRFAGSFDLCASAAGSLLTAVLAAVAALRLSLPDRKRGWALLPLPAALLWIGASAINCLRPWSVVSAGPVALGGTDNCLLFILAVSLPLSISFVLILRSGYSLRPHLTSFACGLASSAAAATLLNFIHAHDSTTSDLAVHAFAVCAVILANRIFGIRFLTTSTFTSKRNKDLGQFESTSGTRFTPTLNTPQDRMENAKYNSRDNRQDFLEPLRADHQGHIIRFHHPGGDGSGRD